MTHTLSLMWARLSSLVWTHVVGGLHQLHLLLVNETAAVMDEVEAVVGLAVGTEDGSRDPALLRKKTRSRAGMTS